MPIAVWTGTLSFGLVTIPVKLYPATQPKDVRFHLMDREGRRIRYRRVVEDTPPVPGWTPAVDVTEDARSEPHEVAPTPSERGEPSAPAAPTEVGFHDLVRGFETDEGTVTLTSEEIEAVRPQRSRTIDVEDFVELADIDPIYFEKAYYVVPADRDAEPPYLLLLRAMQQAGRVAIGRFVLRTRPHLVAIRPMAEALALHTLFFGDEVRESGSSVRLSGVEVDERQLELAMSLIETLKTDWDPDAYSDTYREDLLRIIAEKRPLEEAEPPPERTPARIEELMRALKESVEAAKQGKRTRKREAG
ncbi:MAG TPA: Ku protein [Actinomycetota bacterium]|nr:Ku protein [Actinomycetota bacterium]